MIRYCDRSTIKWKKREEKLATDCIKKRGERESKEEKEREASIASDAVIPQTSVLFHENTWYLQTKLTKTI